MRKKKGRTDFALFRCTFFPSITKRRKYVVFVFFSTFSALYRLFLENSFILHVLTRNTTETSTYYHLNQCSPFEAVFFSRNRRANIFYFCLIPSRLQNIVYVRGIMRKLVNPKFFGRPSIGLARLVHLNFCPVLIRTF